ncbi:hypothetical protein B0H14DRAFT_2835414, partial [Mycena olivaceomarginata]
RQSARAHRRYRPCLVCVTLLPPPLLRHPAAAHSPSRAVLPCRGPGPRPPLLPLPSSARFLHGMQHGQYNGGTGTSPYAPPPGLAPPGSEYPPAAAADWAPPPYVKEADGEAAKYPPPPGPPPPGFDATYASPPGPPPAAHISSNSADFGGGFRPPPAS